MPQDWKREILLGLIVAVPLILLNVFFPQFTSIGFPTALSFSTAFIPAVLFAPIVEELLFRFALVNFLHKVRIPVVMIILLTSALFMAFHFLAYEESFSAQSASFVGAFLFGAVAAFVAIRTRSFVIPTVLHAAFNLWLIIRLYIV